jgi:hypothetical protein
MKRTSAFPRSENADHPYMSKKGRHQPQAPQKGYPVDPHNHMVMKSKNHNTMGLGEVRKGIK